MIVFGSRGSDLALAQTHAVADAIRAATGEDYRVEILSTKGDRILDKPLPMVGGKGLFTEELEQALRDGSIDVAVHSLKDLPVEDAEGLTVGAIPLRAPVHDVLVYDKGATDPEGGTLPLQDGRSIGTSSPRRAAAIRTLRKDLQIKDVRGNVPTRAGRVREGRYDGVILAAAGLERLSLDLEGLARAELSTDAFVPAPGQGALGIQCRAGDERILALLAHIHDDEASRCARAERELLLRLGGGCSMPFGALAEPQPGGGHRLIASLAPRTGAPMGLVQIELEGPSLDTLVEDAARTLTPLAEEPLAGRRVAIFRPGGGDSRLPSWMAVAGAQVETIATSEALPSPCTGDELKASLADDAILAFTSARAVDRFHEEVQRHGLELGERRVFAVGPATADACRTRGLEAEVPGHPAGGETLAGHLLGVITDQQTPIAFPCAEERHPAFEQRLTEAGRAVRPLPLYRLEPLSGIDWPEGDVDLAVWTSPSSVRIYAESGSNAFSAKQHLAIGETTADVLTKHGLGPVAVSEEPAPEQLLEAARTHLSPRDP